eukprot:1519685-Rhodomonas_salina.2
MPFPHVYVHTSGVTEFSRTQSNKSSMVQMAEHPSPDTRFPSSHSSPRSSLPLLHGIIGVDVWPGSVVNSSPIPPSMSVSLHPGAERARLTHHRTCHLRREPRRARRTGGCPWDSRKRPSPARLAQRPSVDPVCGSDRAVCARRDTVGRNRPRRARAQAAVGDPIPAVARALGAVPILVEDLAVDTAPRRYQDAAVPLR